MSLIIGAKKKNRHLATVFEDSTNVSHDTFGVIRPDAHNYFNQGKKGRISHYPVQMIRFLLCLFVVSQRVVLN